MLRVPELFHEEVEMSMVVLTGEAAADELLQVIEDEMVRRAPSPSRVARGHVVGYSDWLEDTRDEVLRDLGLRERRAPVALPVSAADFVR
jgi:hypothetical protein